MSRDRAAEVAARMFEVPVDQVTSTQRRAAKRAIFAYIYGNKDEANRLLAQARRKE